MRSLKILFQNLDTFQGRLTFVFIIGCIDAAVSFCIPVALAFATRGVLTPRGAGMVTAVLAVLLFGSHGMQYVLRGVGESIGPQYAQYLRLKYLKRLEHLPLATLTAHHSGYLLTLLGVVADGVGALTIELFWGFSRAVINVVLFLVFTARESAGLTVLNGAVFLLFILVSAKLSRRMIPTVAQLNLERAELFSIFADSAAHVGTIKRLGIGSMIEARLKRVIARVDARIAAVQRLHAGRWFTLHSLFSLSMLATFSFLLFGVASSEILPSTLIVFVAAFTAVRLNAERLSESYKTIIELDAYVTTLESILDVPARTADIVPERWRRITFNDVEFAYTEASPTVRIPELVLERGETIGIVGVSGEGKTTTLDLLADLRTPQRGERRIDDVPYDQIAEFFFRTSIAFAGQEAELFSMSIRENLTLGREVPERALLEALDALGLSSWTSELENGLDTQVGERGVTLSRGQKQRLNLLRAFLLDREILLIDEPTAHLDDESARCVYDFIHQRIVEKTAVIVTHRPEILGVCGRVYRMSGHQLSVGKG